MKIPLAITDLTRMQGGRVCIAGYDRDGRCLRPTLPPPGIRETNLFAGDRTIVFPFAVVEFDFVTPRPQPPHTEDYDYDPASVRFIRRVKDEKREGLLKLSLFDSVAAIFEQPIHDDLGHYVMDCCGPRSIGTTLPKRIQGVRYGQDPNGKWDYRLRFTDNAGQEYRLKITDLTWHYFCDSRRDEQHGPEQIAVDLSQMLKSRRVYLRIGLSRGWAEHPGKCFLQINAIHTFPDYLEGKIFADFRPATMCPG